MSVEPEETWQERNTRVIAEFRANEGRVGGIFAGAPMVLLRHRGRKSGRELIAPLVCLPHEDDPDVVHVFASAGGAPEHPSWYSNLIAAGAAVVERGVEVFPVAVRELTGAERDRVYGEQVRRYPGFGDYERRTEGVRVIPVLELRRTAEG
ncbi:MULTISPECIES: nitroreductase/quinone reductase family protein [Actinosynnema]|uniref:nitroreductase/quinone reductase family protein n=1 Tax=Actinosynnema TaxID=40566 RepID=UPI0020A374BA|nr:nitroreductase/quinone reductase family protein [Actinosynnema pretiosum]MCP2096400.1 deazaflavin-dependent oxidoreductase, nitroreductase family [Actinosynnema pretiosum]